jgi:CRISPR-associated protein Csx10
MGDRRAEGYGQLCFNDELLMKDKITVDSKSSSNTEKPPSLSDSFNFESAANYANLIQKQAWKTAIDKKALELAADKKDREKILGLGFEERGNLRKSKPSLTQLGALKSVLRKLEKPGESLVVGWIESVKKVTNRKEEWGKSLGKVEDLVTKEGTAWQYLELQKLYPELTITKNGPDVLKRDFWSYAVWTLVDACVRAHKRDLENSNSL